jgi:hypothetical protein
LRVLEVPTVTLKTKLTSLLSITPGTLKNSDHKIQATESALLGQSDYRGRSRMLTHLGAHCDLQMTPTGISFFFVVVGLFGTAAMQAYCTLTP